MHDLFVAKVATMKKNKSYKYGEPMIVELGHSHVFHTFNSQGRPQNRTNEVGGHFHEIEWGEDENGNPFAKCGPAMHKIVKKSANGKKRKIVQLCQWDDFTGNGDEDDKTRDKHRHEMEYINSEEMNADTIRKQRNSGAAQIIAANEARQSGKFDNDEVSMRPM